MKHKTLKILGYYFKRNKIITQKYESKNVLTTRKEKKQIPNDKQRKKLNDKMEYLNEEMVKFFLKNFDHICRFTEPYDNT